MRGEKTTVQKNDEERGTAVGCPYEGFAGWGATRRGQERGPNTEGLETVWEERKVAESEGGDVDWQSAIAPQ